MFRNEATSAPKSIWRSERRCYSNDIITNDARDSYRPLKNCRRIRNQQSNHVFDNDSYRPRGTMIGFYVPESPVAGRFPVALLLVHQQLSLYVVVGVSLSLSLEKERVWSGFSWPSARFSVTYRYRFMTHAKQDRVKADSSLPRSRITNFRFSNSPKIYTHCINLYRRRSREDEDSRQNIGRTTERRNTERWKTRTEDPWTRERKYLEGGRRGRKIERKKGRVGICERRRDRRKCWQINGEENEQRGKERGRWR